MLNQNANSMTKYNLSLYENDDKHAINNGKPQTYASKLNQIYKILSPTPEC